MKILVVEDEIKINNAIKKGLIAENFEVDSVFDGEEGLAYIHTNLYDVVILDLMIPKVSGLQIIKTIRDKKNYIPVLILTARDSIDNKVEGLTIGADDYLTKPFSFDELVVRIKSLIRRSTTNTFSLKVDTLELDPYTYRAKRGGEEIILSKKDFMLLEYLMQHNGSIVSESKIIQRIWNDSDDVISNVVAAHIKSIRQKIDKSFPKEKQLLTTVRGLGYKLHG